MDALPTIDGTTLVDFMDAVIPADDHPSASAAGGGRFLIRLLTKQPGWRDRVERALGEFHRARGDQSAGIDRTRAPDLEALVEADADVRWLAELIQGGYYADPGNLGNDRGRSWQMIGWSPNPEGGWNAPRWTEETPRTARITELSDRYDAIVIGSGAGGGVAAAVLAEAG